MPNAGLLKAINTKISLYMFLLFWFNTNISLENNPKANSIQ